MWKYSGFLLLVASVTWMSCFNIDEYIETDEFKNMVNECSAANNNVDIWSLKGDDAKVFENKDLRCGVSCIGSKMNLWNDKGSVNYDHIFVKFNVTEESSAIKFTKQCEEKYKNLADICDKTFNLLVCVLKEV